MEMYNNSFTEWWKSLSPIEKDTTNIEIAKDCNAALSTVLSWGLGYRTPKPRSQEIIVKYFAGKGIVTDCKTLFP